MACDSVDFKRIIMRFKLYLIITMSFMFMNGLAQNQHSYKLSTEQFIYDWDNPLTHWGYVGQLRLDSLLINETNNEALFFFNKTLSYLPWREDQLSAFNTSLVNALSDELKNYQIAIYTNGDELRDLIPNIYRLNENIDSTRLNDKINGSHIKRTSQDDFPKGLTDNHIALWHSHGWYYESKLDRWEWQRARLYSTVEDIFPMTYVLPYLVPMLENAGANIYLPRERCFNPNEIIVDNDESTAQSKIKLESKLEKYILLGYAHKDTLFPGDNPFQMGTSLRITNANGKIATFEAEIPNEGEYGVYIAYQQDDQNSREVDYTVQHSGGSSSFIIDQQMGGGTWIYLGSFHFIKGQNAIVEVSGQGQISVDAIKLGGGYGHVARRPSDELSANQWSLNNNPNNKNEITIVNPEQYSWKISQRPRYMEAARYWLQYAGMPDTLVFSLNDEKNDYNDDYQSRGEWVDYLIGSPAGPMKDRNKEGLKLPIDLAFAFHTDAGVTPNDSVIGTLGIYSSERDSGYFQNGQSKLASRDLTDIIQTQVVEDIRTLYKKDWTRRGIWNKQYSEAWRPNVPTMLLELLSHQNLADMRLGLDPNFQFDVSRAIYKGILKFLAYQEQRQFVVQPLPVSHMAITETKKGFELSWQPLIDSLEETAVPDKYKVYRRIGTNGFDDGTMVTGTSYPLPKIRKGQIVSYKVTALNEGGESMPSEVLSIGMARKRAEKVLVVNAFDRLSAPSFIDEGDFAGIAWWDDHGVPDKYNYSYTGQQYDFDRQSPWLDDDSPGWGASYGNDEGKIIKGNSFDNVILHGESILKAGYSFISVSDEAFEDAQYDASPYNVVDVIFGEERTTPSYNGKEHRYKIFTQGMMNKLKELTVNKQHVFMSGAYLGSDIHLTKDTVAKDFAADVLRFKWRSNHASKTGIVYTTDLAAPSFKGNMVFNTDYHPDVYTVEAPDAIEPLGINAVTAFRYSENNASAGIMYNGDYKTVIMGFPFEAIIAEKERDKLMQQVLEYFYRKQKKKSR